MSIATGQWSKKGDLDRLESDVARRVFGEAVVDDVHRHMATMLAAGGSHIDAYYYCPRHSDGKMALRPLG